MRKNRQEKPSYYLEYLIKTQYFPQSFYHRAKLDITRTLVTELPKGSLILDAGCGIGNVTSPYCTDYKIIGIDEQQSAIDYCKNHHKGKYIKADLTKRLPFKNDFFNLILFHDSIEHFTEPKTALIELARVLKKDGKIVISTINYANPLWFILENTWHRIVAGNCETYSCDVHPTRYTEKLLREHSEGLFKELALFKKVLNMELFYIGKK